MDYEFLIGQTFAVEGETYRVAGVAPGANGVDVRSFREGAPEVIEVFPVREVIDALICDEEIVLDLPRLRVV